MLLFHTRHKRFQNVGRQIDEPIEALKWLTHSNISLIMFGCNIKICSLLYADNEYSIEKSPLSPERKRIVECTTTDLNH